MEGRLIVFEGIDGSGKSTQLEMFKSLYPTRFFYASEPWDRERIKNLIFGESKLSPRDLTNVFIEDRLNHLDKVLIPQMSKGQNVVCDRYRFSTEAYQGAQGIDYGEIEQIHEEKGVFDADLTLYFDLPLGVALERLSKRSGKKDIFEREDFLRRIANNYYSIIGRRKASGDDSIVTIDANRPSSDVHKSVVETIVDYGFLHYPDLMI